jgi:hypothetical protein
MHNRLNNTFLCACLLLLSGCIPADYEMLKQRVAQLETERRSFDAERQRFESVKQQQESQREKLYREISDLKLKIPKEDFQYSLFKKEHIHGDLVDTNRINKMNMQPELKRIAPQYLLYFKGVHTDKEYPPISVSETIFQGFTEGFVYSREDVNRIRR